MTTYGTAKCTTCSKSIFLFQCDLCLKWFCKKCLSTQSLDKNGKRTTDINKRVRCKKCDRDIKKWKADNLRET